MKGTRRRGLVGAICVLAAIPTLARQADPDAALRSANERARGRDFPKAIEAYEQLATEGHESASLYWNWAQAATARGALGEALWALLRAREVEPGDRAVLREIERAREAMNLDQAEIDPEPLATLARASRRWQVPLAAAVLLAISVLTHVLARSRWGNPWLERSTWVAFAAGAALAAVVTLASRARPTASVIRRGAPLIDAASPTAQPVGSLREGEVVPVLDESGDYLRIEDSSGARGWVSRLDLRRLDRPPAR